jgi:hypothetical protein
MAQAPIPVAPARQTEAPREVRIVSHSTLYYWWPVWVLGYICALVTVMSHDRLAVVPAGTDIVQQMDLPGREGKRDVLIFPANAQWRDIDRETKQPRAPHLRISPTRWPGVLFCFTTLAVIFSTNVALRGLWSFIVILALGIIWFVLYHFGLWDDIVGYLTVLDIRINMGGYLLISTVLLVFWLITFFYFDDRVYMVFSPGQLRVRLEVGDSETAYDTTGMTIQKQRSDFFRHWVLGLGFLGLGAGDLEIRTSGAQAHTFDMPNVLMPMRRIRQVETMLRQRSVVSSQ